MVHKDIYPKYRGWHEISTASRRTMDIPTPMNLNLYINTNCKLHAVYNDISNKTMQRESFETKRKILGNASDIGNSVDMAKECLNVAELSKVCKSYQMWKGKDDSEDLGWKNTYIYSINHTGNSGSTEVCGV